MLPYTAAMRALLVVFAAAASACGQTGSLYLPDEDIGTPVEIRGPAPTPPQPVTPAPEAADEEEDEAEETRPPGG